MMMPASEIPFFHRRLFRLLPKSRALLQAQDGEVLKAFVTFAEEQNLPMDWTTHIYFLHWLKQQGQWQSLIQPEIIKEILVAGVVRWSLSGFEDIDARGIVVVSSYLPANGVAFLKSEEVDVAGKPLLLTFQAMPATDGYALSYESGCWENLHWQPFLHLT